ncbi:VOC family protein [Rouxiella aceris]|uniref:hypothetical protein n=1 Tax=Rouxiella aceris TaxID=2703884 RepID=UPI001B7D73DF|nr:hypothetical protein [Rouxiella aceris]
MIIRGIEHIGVTVSSLTEAEQFFIDTLDATVLYRIVPPAKQIRLIPKSLPGLFSWTISDLPTPS